jgi:hypothetical protein
MKLRCLLAVTLLLLAPAAWAQTLIHYTLNDTANDVNLVASGIVPNAGTLGNGIVSNHISLDLIIPTNGVPPGAGNVSIYFNGNGGILAPGTQQLNNTAIFNAGGFTYEAWFYSTGGGTYNAIVDYAGTQKLFRLASETGPQMEYYDTNHSPVAFLVGNATSNQWHYAAVVFTATSLDSQTNVHGNFTFYLDSSAPAYSVPNIIISPYGDSLDRTIGVGMHPVGFADNYFNGLIYEPRVTLGALPYYNLLFKPGVVVTTTNDSGAGSLRAAVANAPNGAAITFAPALNGQIITLTSGQIELSKTVTIDASSLGNGISITGNNQSRIFEITNNAIVVLNSLTLANGNWNGADSYGGGGILNFSTLTINNSTLAGNQANGSSIGGGGIDSYGTLTVNNSTFAYNQANGSSIGGGGIISYGTFTGNNCTFSLNQANGSGGGGIFNNGTLNLTNCIICLNSALTEPDIDNEGSISLGNYLLGVNPLLAPLDNYGGPTLTMPPVPGSPAIDTGTDSVTNFLATDQRGMPRKSGLHVDIGAVEFQPGDTNAVVTTTADSGLGSLRQVVQNQEAFGTPTPITFTNTLSGQTILLTGGQIVLNNNVTIDASALADGIQINGNGQSRIFEITNATVVLHSLTITNGYDDTIGGGGILNYGTLTLNECTLAGNLANGGDGGGIVSAGTLVVNQCTLAGNSANSGNGGGIAAGGGTLVVNQSTLAGNSANGGYYGGGIAIQNGTLLVTNSIVAANTALVGADIFIFSGVVTFGGANLVRDLYGGGGTVNGTYLTAAPDLAPLGNYGGPTQTMPPEPGSPALGAGNVAAASQFSTDQRGLPRVVSGKVDIGAVEVQSGQAYSIVENTLDNGPGSLRQVISNAPAGATVTFAPNLSGQTITLTAGQIVLSNSLYIYGTGLSDGVQINGHGNSRIFQVNSGTTAILDGLTLTNGNPGANPGGAIFNSSGTLLELAACTLAGNSSSQGGAIENQGTCALFECTLTGNSASGNGGAIDNNQGPLTLLQCTLAGNTASGAGGGIANFLNTLAMTNCIIAGNSSQDIYNFASSTVNAGGTNLVQSYVNAGTFNGTGSLVLNAPLLATLGNYGGPTPTMPPLRGSPAIDGGSTVALTSENFTNDQRGFPRVSGTRVDIGAVEVQIATASFPLTGLTWLGNRSFQFDLTNLPGGSFTVFATTNLALNFNTWSNLGPVLETPPGSGVFQFTDTHATNYPRRFYRVSSP